ncbi:MAG: imelysin family protein [Cytophagales bacterium]
MNIITIKNAILVSILTIVFASCKPQKNTETIDTQSQREGFLQNLADNYITVELNAFKRKTDSLVIATNKFATNLNLQNLAELQSAHDRAYAQYLKIDALRNVEAIQPNVSLGFTLYQYVGVFRCKTKFVDSLINLNKFNPDDLNINTRGLSVTEYLLFRTDGNQDSIINKFSNAKRLNYLVKNSKYIDSLAGLSLNTWNGQKSTYAQSASNDAGSNLSTFFNSFCQSYETSKNDKVKIPGGFTTSLDTLSIESYYAGYSKKYLKLHISTLKTIWFGNFTSSRTDGFDDIVYAQVKDSTFIKNVNTRFDNVLKAIDALPEKRFNKTIAENPAEFKAVYDAMVELTHLIKTEMYSKFGFYVTYNSNDGD